MQDRDGLRLIFLCACCFELSSMQVLSAAWLEGSDFPVDWCFYHVCKFFSFSASYKASHWVEYFNLHLFFGYSNKVALLEKILVMCSVCSINSIGRNREAFLYCLFHNINQHHFSKPSWDFHSSIFWSVHSLHYLMGFNHSSLCK